LIESADLFIVYDNIKYTKKGWINRNRILKDGKKALVSVPLKSNSNYLDVRDRKLSEDFRRTKLVNQIKGAYQSAPNFLQVFPMVEKTILNDEFNLFRFLLNTIVNVCEYLKITTEITISSSISIDHTLKSQNKVIALCREVGATIYINPVGGRELYSKNFFQSEGIKLKFIEPYPFYYDQFENEFVPWLSIIDVMMFNSVGVIREYLVSKWK